MSGRYLSGEKPMVGDLVEVIDYPRYESQFHGVTLLVVTACDDMWVAFKFDKFQDHPGWSPARFRLVQRANKKRSER